MDMKAAMDMTVDILDMFGDEEAEVEEGMTEEEQKEFDAGIEEMFKDVPDGDDSEYDPDEVDEPEWDEGTTEEQKKEGRREIRRINRQVSEEIDALFDEWVKDGTCIVADSWD